MIISIPLRNDGTFMYNNCEFTCAECCVPREFGIKNDRYDTYIVMARLRTENEEFCEYFDEELCEYFDEELCEYFDVVPGTFQYGACLLKHDGLEIEQKLLDDYIEQHKGTIV